MPPTKEQLLTIKDVWNAISELFPVDQEWFADMPVPEQKEILAEILADLKSDHDREVLLFKLISYYWPRGLKLPVEPVPAIGIAPMILVQTAPTGPANPAEANEAVSLENFVMFFSNSFMTYQKMTQGLSDYFAGVDPLEGLTPKQQQAVREKLGRYRCPREDTCPHVDDNGCAFSHKDSAPELPNYVCFDHLVSNCREDLRDWRAAKRQDDMELGEEACANDECRFGVHVSAEELAAGFDTNPANQARIKAYREQYPDEDYECTICKDNIRLDRRVPTQMEYCIFPNCNHIHCARCVIKVSKSKNPLISQKPYKCSCNCDSDKVYFRHYEPTIANVSLKKRMFAAMPSSLVHINVGSITFKKFPNPSQKGFGHGIFIKGLMFHNSDVPLPSRIIDVIIRAKLDFAEHECNMAFFPPLLAHHFGLSRDDVVRHLSILTQNGQKLYEFDYKTSTFVLFRP